MRTHARCLRLAAATAALEVAALALAPGSGRGEPARTRVVEVRFEGVRAFSPRALERYLETRRTRPWYRRGYRDSTFAADLANLQLFYRNEGYLQACVWAGPASWDRDSSAVRPCVRVHEGRRWSVDRVDVDAAGPLTADSLLAGTELRPGRPYRPPSLMADLQTILVTLTCRAYLDAQLSQEVTASAASATVHLRYNVVAGEPARIGRIDIAGLRKTRPLVVIRELQFDSGEMLLGAPVARSQAALIATGLFTSVRIAPAPGQEGRPVKDLLIEVTERSPGDASLGAGFATSEGARLRLQMRQLDLRGSGRRVGLDARLSQRRRLVEVSATEPWLLGARLSLDALSAYEHRREPSFTAESVHGSLALRRALGRRWSIDGGYHLQRTQLLEARVEVPALPRTGRVGKLMLGAARETRDDLFESRRGSLARLEVGLGSSRLGGSRDFLSAAVVARKFWPLGARVVLAAALRQADIWLQRAGDDLPLEDRLYAGGESSVRGFAHHALGPRDARGAVLGGRHASEVALELRAPLGSHLGGVLFVDAGQLVGAASELLLDGYALGCGFGLRLRTPVGLLRSDVGFPLTSAAASGAQIYFGVGQSF